MSRHASAYVVGEMLAYLKNHGHQQAFEWFLAQVPDADMVAVQRGMDAPASELPPVSYRVHPGHREFGELVREMQRGGCGCGQLHDTPLTRTEGDLSEVPS